MPLSVENRKNLIYSTRLFKCVFGRVAYRASPVIRKVLEFLALLCLIIFITAHRACPHNHILLSLKYVPGEFLPDLASMATGGAAPYGAFRLAVQGAAARGAWTRDPGALVHISARRGVRRVAAGRHRKKTGSHQDKA